MPKRSATQSATGSTKVKKARPSQDARESEPLIKKLRKQLLAIQGALDRLTENEIQATLYTGAAGVLAQQADCAYMGGCLFKLGFFRWSSCGLGLVRPHITLICSSNVWPWA